ncbi:MAG: FixH family protein [Paracoccaceae bacterium]
MSDTPKPLTGRKVLAIVVAAFAVVIAANLTLMFAATGTFPGLVVRNGYVASQQFDARLKAQRALGWTGRSDYEGGVIRLQLTATDGSPADATAVSAMIGRTTEAKDDRTLDFEFNGRDWIAEAALAPGRWRLEITALAADGTRFTQAHRISVQED